MALVALAPLLPLTPGVLHLRHRSLVWGMFLLMLYFIIGIMEGWANAPQRVAALVQVALCCGYFAGLVLVNRPGTRPPD